MDARPLDLMLPDRPVVMANVGWPAGHADGAGPLRHAAHNTALAQVRAAVGNGARLVDLGPAGPAAVAAVRAACPGVLVCADAPGADLTRDSELASRTSAALVHTGPARSRRSGNGPQRPGGTAAGAGAAGQAPAGASPVGTTLVAAAPADVGWLLRDGWAVVVDVDAADLAATVAVASVCAWLGAPVVRTRHVAAVRQALEMVESIRGTRAPSWTRRGLA